MVKSQGLDWYREDLNGDGYGTAWRKADAPDRQGITENLHVQGHLAFWDELRRRNPNLRLDSCASGGRRNDLETMRRAVPLLRSDWSCMPFKDAPLQTEGNQSQTYGLSSWLPWQGAGVHFTDSYSVRSYFLTGFGMIIRGGWKKTEESIAAVRKGYADCRRIAPLMLGDYFPLTPHSLDTTSWIAWQFHRADLGEGIVQAFRRPDARVTRSPSNFAASFRSNATRSKTSTAAKKSAPALNSCGATKSSSARNPLPQCSC
jgi:alpha-galactosidase